MTKFFMTLAAAAFTVSAVSADVVSSNPDPLFQTSQNVVITYRPDDSGSNKALANLPSSTQLYAHIGVITSASTSDSDWKHASTWLDNSDKYKLTYVGPNEYTINLGTLSSYFNLASGETVKKIAFVFRDANASKQGKTSSNGDIFLDVMSNTNPTLTATYTPNATKFMVGDQVSVKIVSSTVADITFSITNGPVLASASQTNVLEYTHTFTKDQVGSVQFVASNGGINTDKKKTVTVADGTYEEYPGGKPVMGTVRNADGSVTFCLAAPQITSVRLIGSWDGDNWSENLPSQEMKYCTYNGDRYFWTTVNGLDPDSQYLYYYYTDGNKRVADPYSKLVLIKGTDNGNNIKGTWDEGEMSLPEFPSACQSSLLTVFQEDMNDYDWDPFNIPNHNGLYIYEMLFRDFTGTEGQAQGNGTVRAAIEKIPYLKNLGINAVELMPIMEFEGNLSWGYNTNYYMAPDKVYGSPVDYKDFINECHKNGIAVILDIVFNQCQNHPWYSMYSSGQNPFINSKAPHDYSVLNDWRQDNPIVEQHWVDVLQYWLKEYNVDGFRFDLVKGLGDNDSYGSGTEAFNQSRVDRMKRLHAAMKQIKPDAIHINEFLGSASEEKAFSEDGQLVWAKYSDNCYNYAKGNPSGSTLHYFSGMGSTVPWNYRVTYAESHDEQRVAYNAYNSGVSGVKGSWPVVARRLEQLAVQKLVAPGPQMIWQFEELANDENTKNGNDNNTGTKKVRWNDLEKDYVKHLHDTYAALGQLRQTCPALFTNANVYKQQGVASGSFTNMRTITLFYNDAEAGPVEVIAFMNPTVSGSAQTVSVTPNHMTPANAQLICSTEGVTPVLTDNGGKLEVSLAPNAFVVYATQSVLGVEDAIVGGDVTPGFEVYGGDGEIVIVGEYTNADVYSIQGMSMGRLNGLDRGIYVVHVDGKTFKVAVR